MGSGACTQVWEPDALADTSAAHLQHRHKLTPYKDVRLHGRVHATFVRGHQVMGAPECFCDKAIHLHRRSSK